MLAFPSVDPGEFVEFGDFSSDVDGQRGWIPAGDQLNAGFTFEDGLRKGWLSDSIRADDAHSCDHNPRRQWLSKYSA